MRETGRSCFLDIESSSHYPFYGRLIVIGIKDSMNKDVWVFHDEKECILLKEFLKFFFEKDYTTVIGYNIEHDIRYIFAKCLKYRIPASQFFHSTQIDIMDYMKAGYSRPGKLQEWMGGLGRPAQRRPSIRDLYNQGRMGEIIDHNGWDLDALDLLWDRITIVMSDNSEGGVQ